MFNFLDFRNTVTYLHWHKREESYYHDNGENLYWQLAYKRTQSCRTIVSYKDEGKNHSNWECVKILLSFTARNLELSKAVGQHWWHSSDKVSFTIWDVSKPLLWSQLLCSLGTKVLFCHSLLWCKLQFTSIYYAAVGCKFRFLRSRTRMENIFNTAEFCQEMPLTKHKLFCPTFLSFFLRFTRLIGWIPDRLLESPELPHCAMPGDELNTISHILWDGADRLRSPKPQGQPSCQGHEDRGPQTFSLTVE